MEKFEENCLVIDQIIDNFGEDELLEEDSTEDDKSDHHSSVTCDVDEENTIAEDESMFISEQDSEALSGILSLILHTLYIVCHFS